MSLRAVLILYNLLLPLALLFSAPGFVRKMIKRGGYGENFLQRFGIYTPEVRRRLWTNPPIWIHAVSVGEVLIALKFIAALRAINPSQPLVLSTTTSTGYFLARSRQDGQFTAIYNPIDFPLCVSRAFTRIRPRLIVLIEAEFWPNLLRRAKADDIPVALINARLSPRSEQRYRKFSFLTQPLFALLDRVLVQTEEDKQRWISLGVRPETIACHGSIKFDEEGLPDPFEQVFRFRRILDRLRGDRRGPVVLAGSTHPGEEKLIATVFRDLHPKFPDAFLVLVPRHFERAADVVRDVKSTGLHPVLKTQCEEETPPSPDTCLIIDTTGELRAWYRLADVVLIGKSFLAEGGQNPVEPIMAGKPIIVGPHMENFSHFTTRLIQGVGCLQLESPAGLGSALRALLASPEKRATLAANARRLLKPHQGAAGRSAHDVLKLLKN